MTDTVNSPSDSKGEIVTTHPDWWTDLDTKAVDTARLLAADAVQKVGNGHPGTAMSLAPLAYLLYQRVMRHDPTDPTWVGRDRFMLSNGHSSLTQYCQLFLSGYGLDVTDLESLRTWGSLTPGHPEFGHTLGVEVTTGPLGQGVANAVGMAMAARRERGLFDPEPGWGESPFDHYIYVVAGDGCMEEGVASEASSLAGHQQLGNLILFYDDNHISIEDDTAVAFSEDVLKRYEAYGWHVQYVESGEDVVALEAAIAAAQGGDRQAVDHRGPHDHRLAGADEAEHRQGARQRARRGRDPRDEGVPRLRPRRPLRRRRRGAAAQPRGRRSAAATRTPNGRSPSTPGRPATPTAPHCSSGWQRAGCPTAGRTRVPTFPTEKDGKPNAVSTRAASGKVLGALADVLPELWGGSADLAESNNTTMEGQPSFIPAAHQTKTWSGGPYGRTLHFGIREHAMGAIINGITLHGGTRVYGGTFLVFSDYMRPPVRLAALMQIPSIFVWTHDSIGLGARRPDAPADRAAGRAACDPRPRRRPPGRRQRDRRVLAGTTSRRPTARSGSRSRGRTCPSSTPRRSSTPRKGGYVLEEGSKGLPDVILVATGSEVSLAL